MMAPRSLLTPPRAAQAPPPNSATPSGLPRRRHVHELDLVPLDGGEASLAGELTTVAPGSMDASAPAPPQMALAVAPRRMVQTYQPPERLDVGGVRPTAAALAHVSAVGRDPFASAVSVGAAHSTLVAQRLLDKQSQCQPTVAEWRSSPALRRFFWLCLRCSVTNANDASCCHTCHDERDAILRSTAADEMAALSATSQHTAYGRGLVICQPVAAPPYLRAPSH